MSRTISLGIVTHRLAVDPDNYHSCMEPQDPVEKRTAHVFGHQEMQVFHSHEILLEMLMMWVDLYGHLFLCQTPGTLTNSNNVSFMGQIQFWEKIITYFRHTDGILHLFFISNFINSFPITPFQTLLTQQPCVVSTHVQHGPALSCRLSC